VSSWSFFAFIAGLINSYTRTSRTMKRRLRLKDELTKEKPGHRLMIIGQYQRSLIISSMT
jgi:hypothetical protein